MSWLIGGTIGVVIYAAFLYCLHLFFTRRERADVAAGNVFRARMRKHVRTGYIWS